MKMPQSVLAIIAACALSAASLAAQSANSTAPSTASGQTGSTVVAQPAGSQAASAPAAATPGASSTALVAGSAPAPAKLHPAAMVPAGTTLRVQLDTTLTDKTNKSGDAFTGEISSPVYISGKQVIPKYSTVNGHIAFLKPSGRFAGKAQMRLVLDNITTPDGVVFPLAGTLEEAQGGVCAHTALTGKTKADEEGTITGCGKSKKKAAEAAAIVGGMGAGVGASIGMGKEIECDWYGYCPPGGSGMGTDIMYGAGIGAGTALIYTLFKHERHIVLVQGSLLTFTVDRTTMAEKAPATSSPSAE